MAKIYGLNGIIRGRQGNNVFSVQNGTQVVKAYQPVVFNPRTNAQQSQRVKFSLAGRISSATPSSALIGMPGGSNRGRRAAFVRQIISLASVSSNSGSLVASVPYAQLVFSEGSLAQYSASPSVTAVWAGTEAFSRVNVTIPAWQSAQIAVDAPEGYGELVVVALFDATTSKLDEVRAVLRISTSQTLTFRQGARRDCYVNVYVVPFAPREGGATFRTTFLGATGTDVNVDSISNSLLAGMNFGQSVYVSTIPVLGSAQMAAPAPDDSER